MQAADRHVQGESGTSVVPLGVGLGLWGTEAGLRARPEGEGGIVPPLWVDVVHL